MAQRDIDSIIASSSANFRNPLVVLGLKENFIKCSFGGNCKHIFAFKNKIKKKMKFNSYLYNTLQIQVFFSIRLFLYCSKEMSFTMRNIAKTMF